MTTINYNGQPVELITSGYWPDGIDLICSDDCENWREERVVCLHNNRCLRMQTSDAHRTMLWRYWAIKPTKPAPRRLTNREVAELCKKGWDIMFCGDVFYGHIPVKTDLRAENSAVHINIGALRAPGSDEWVEPTSDLLEAKK